MSLNAQESARYRVLRAYSQALREWLDAHPEHKPGDKKPSIGLGVIICVSGEELDRMCDRAIEEGFGP